MKASLTAENVIFEELVGHSRIRYFSYGRHALAEGLKAACIGKGDRVLLPAFICRDLLSSIHAISAIPVYYSVDEKLCLSVPPEELPEAKAVIAVNYFGFSQDLAPFRDYCDRTGAVLIEDNAHGLFSSDEAGQLLGTRGNLGIFSLRKTILMPDGSALVLNKENSSYRLAPQVEFSKSPEPVSLKIKRLLMRLTPLTGTVPLMTFTIIARRVRRLATGHEILPSPPDAEQALPGSPNPCRHLLNYLAAVNVDKEIERRRKRYREVQAILYGMPCRPVFEVLPDKAVPYGYPFYCPENGIAGIRKILRKHALECFRWPELPDEVKPSAPEHYRTIWFVNFL